MAQDERPLMVTIRCITYNHESYIRECLEGFVMQKTNFRFEAIVHDDASTDGTAAIIREYAENYPDIIKPIIETENQYSKGDGSLDRIMNNHTYGKYVSFCEGDDYWIDPLKLQKQVDFLEANPDCGLVYSKAHILQEKEYIGSVGKPAYSYLDILNDNSIPTLTTMFRKNLYDDYFKEIKPYNKSWLMGDYPIWLFMTYKSKFKYMDEFLAVYRLLPNSASHSTNKHKHFLFTINTIDIQLFFCQYYGDTKSMKKFEMLKNRIRLYYNLLEGNPISEEIMCIRKSTPTCFKDFVIWMVSFLYPIIISDNFLKKALIAKRDFVNG